MLQDPNNFTEEFISIYTKTIEEFLEFMFNHYNNFDKDLLIDLKFLKIGINPYLLFTSPKVDFGLFYEEIENYTKEDLL